LKIISLVSQTGNGLKSKIINLILRVSEKYCDWCAKLQQTVVEINESKDIATFKRNVGKLMAVFNPFDGCASFVHGKRDIKEFMTDLNKKYDESIIEERKNDILKNISTVQNNDWKRSEKEMNGVIRTLTLIILAIVNIILLSGCYLLDGYLSCNYTSDCVLVDLIKYLQYSIVITDIIFVCIFAKNCEYGGWKRALAIIFCVLIIVALCYILFSRFVSGTTISELTEALILSNLLIVSLYYLMFGARKQQRNNIDISRDNGKNTTSDKNVNLTVSGEMDVLVINQADNEKPGK
jgi:thioredoxin-related protein